MGTQKTNLDGMHKVETISKKILFGNNFGLSEKVVKVIVSVDLTSNINLLCNHSGVTKIRKLTLIYVG